MDFINKYPYTDFHELNLDYVLEVTKANKAALEDLEGYAQEITDLQTAIDNAVADIQTNQTAIDNINTIIYNGRSVTQTQPRTIARFLNYTNINNAYEMPPWTFFKAVGATIQPLLGSNFTDTLSSGIDYILTRISLTGFNGNSFVYDLRRLSSTEHWFGYSLDSDPTEIFWSRIPASLDTTLKVSGAAADAAATGAEFFKGRDTNYNSTRIMTRFTGYSDISTAQAMPDWSYISTTGANIQPLLGPNFTDTLVSATEYVLRKYSTRVFNQAPYRFELESLGGGSQWIGYLVSGQTDITWLHLPDNAQFGAMTTTINEINNTKRRFIYTTFQQIPGLWTDDGMDANFYHSEDIKVVPGETLYRQYRISQNTQAIWRDADHNRIGILSTNDMARVDYQTANGNNPATQLNDTTYGPIWEFTVPSGAYYISLNLSTSTSYAYREGLSNFLVMGHRDTQNFSFDLDDPIYASKKDKKLCIIGPSTAYLDRKWVNSISEFLSGFPEYLIPFYGSVTVLGYDGCPYGDADDANQTSYYQSIYKRIVTNQMDLSSYDEFLLVGDSNMIPATGPGAYGDYWTLPADGHGYVSAVRNIINYINTQVTRAKIYVCTLTYNKRMHDNASRSAVPDMPDPTTDGAIIYQINTLLRAMAQMISVDLIDLAKETGFTDESYNAYTYDGTHFNQEGCELIGMILRKHMIGI